MVAPDERGAPEQRVRAARLPPDVAADRVDVAVGVHGCHERDVVGVRLARVVVEQHRVADVRSRLHRTVPAEVAGPGVETGRVDTRLRPYPFDEVRAPELALAARLESDPALAVGRAVLLAEVVAGKAGQVVRGRRRGGARGADRERDADDADGERGSGDAHESPDVHVFCLSSFSDADGAVRS